MIGQTISHYSALCSASQESRFGAESKKRENPAGKRNPRKRDRILEKLGEVRLVPQSGTDETSSQFTLFEREEAGIE